MARKLDVKTGKFVVRTRVPDGPKVSGTMTALEKIEWMKIHNPRAKLIPFSPTYYRAVAEMNVKVRGTLKRPEVPEWFCGHVNDHWPYFEDDDANRTAGDDLFSMTKKPEADTKNDGYPWDQCCEYGMEPNTPGYMWCDEPRNYAVNEDESFLRDFTMDVVYEDAVFPTAVDGEGGDCIPTSDTELPANSGEWSCGGWGGGSIGAAGVTIGSASISGRSTLSWGYTKGKSIVDGWGVDNTLICLGLFAEGKWYSGKIDWVRAGQTSKGLENVKCGYSGWTAGALAKATKGKCCVCHDTKKICSNWKEFSI